MFYNDVKCGEEYRLSSMRIALKDWFQKGAVVKVLEKSMDGDITVQDVSHLGFKWHCKACELEELEYKPMSLDEAINHCIDRTRQDCSKCAKDHMQLAKWLMQLRELRRLAQDIDN